MTRITSSLFLASLLALGLSVAPAHAQLSRTYVSAAIGNDANNCDRPTPCRTFQVAHNKTNTDGEITVLDPGGYGGLTITKSISIVNDGVGEASILVSGGATGITINAPPVAGYVNLRGITIQGIGFGGGTGLRFNTGFAFTMTNCVVRNHTGNGIELFAMNGNLSVSNTLVADNGGNGIFLILASGFGHVMAVFNRVEAHNNSMNGINIFGSDSTGHMNATVADSVAANNGGAGFRVHSNQPLVRLMVVRSVSANNLAGIRAIEGVAVLWIGQSTVTGNTTSWQATNGATLRSFGDNNIAGNDDGDPAPPFIAKK